MSSGKTLRREPISARASLEQGSAIAAGKLDRDSLHER